MAVPHISDFCAIDLVDDAGVTQRLAVAHVDPAKVELARSFQEQYPENPAAPYSVAEVTKTGHQVLLEQVTDDMLVGAAQDEGHLRARQR